MGVRRTSLLRLAAAILVVDDGFASGLILPRAASEATSNKFLSFPVHRHRRWNVGFGRLGKRDDDVPLYNHSTVAYMVELDIGTPAQKVRVQLDTGSDELWLDPDCSAVSSTAAAQLCSSLGVYDPSGSSTFQDQGVSTQLSYGLGEAKIEYVSDNIAIPGRSSSKVLQNVIFGVATASKDAAVPILGVGWGKGYNLKYNNVVDELAAQGVTESKAFSLALGSSTVAPQNDGSSGVVIFGGVDTKRFVGKLHQFDNLPPQEGDEGLWRYWIQLDSVGLTKKSNGGGSSTYPGSEVAIVLDSGSSYCYLPPDVVNRLAGDLGGQVADDGSSVPVPCPSSSSTSSVDFAFGPLTIHVPLAEFVRRLDDGSCEAAVLPVSDSGTAILGDSFLRSAYVVFDQSNRHIFMAPYANCGSNEKQLSPAGGAAASMTGECSAASGAVPTQRPSLSAWVLALACVVGQRIVLLAI